MTTVSITYVTDENANTLDLLEIIQQSRDTYTVWVCDKAHFKRMLWAGIEDGDLVTLQRRIAEMGLDKCLMGVTNRNEIWVYAGAFIPYFTSLIFEQKWMMISDVFNAMLQDKPRLLTLYHTDLTPTTDQHEIAIFIMKTLTTGLVVDGIVHWFVTTTDLKDRKVFTLRKGDTKGDTNLVTLPDGWTGVDLIELIGGGKNSLTARNGDTTCTGYVDDDAVIKWLISEAVTSPGIRPAAPGLQPTAPGTRPTAPTPGN